MTNKVARFSSDYHTIPKEEIIDAVSELCENLNLGSGRTPDFDLYSLLEKYLLDSTARDAMNVILKNSAAS